MFLSLSYHIMGTQYWPIVVFLLNNFRGKWGAEVCVSSSSLLPNTHWYWHIWHITGTSVEYSVLPTASCTQSYSSCCMGCNFSVTCPRTCGARSRGSVHQFSEPLHLTYSRSRISASGILGCKSNIRKTHIVILMIPEILALCCSVQ